MKVLFVSSGNSKLGISPIIKNQGESLINKGVELDFFTIRGKGVVGYLKSVLKLRKYLKNRSYDLIHAHFAFSAFTASLSGARPLVVSLMGSDVNAKMFYRILIKNFNIIFWSRVIVKSKAMYEKINISKAEIIPNGVDYKKFKPVSKPLTQQILGWDEKKKHILFAANPNRLVKNFTLASQAFDQIKNGNEELHFLNDVLNEDMNYYYNSSDVVLLTSQWEGSPNVIKEAMACNIPIVSTDVGDVRDMIGGTKGCYVTSFEPKNVAINIKKALTYGKRTNGRKNIEHMESEKVAQKIVKVYQRILE